MNMTDRFEMDLQLFAEGAAAGDGGTAEGTNAGVTEAVAALRRSEEHTSELQSRI